MVAMVVRLPWANISGVDPFRSVMKLSLAALLLMGSLSISAAEIPFDRADEFPARAYELIAETRVVWFGEIHGTKDAPELLLGLVKLISKHYDAAPVVALEIPKSGQAAIEGYMASGDQSLLRKSVIFKSEFKDGRSSRALVQLLSELRKMKLAAVICFDVDNAKTAQERDTTMAENLRLAAEKYPTAKLVVLSGNVHSRIVEGTEWDPSYRPAAFELSQKIASVVTFTIAFESGTAWVRTNSGFGEQKMRGFPWNGTAPHYNSFHAEPIRGHHGVIFTRTLTGSPPW